MNEHEASVLNRLTDKGGPGWGFAALIVTRPWFYVLLGGGGGAGALMKGGRALGWW